MRDPRGPQTHGVHSQRSIPRVVRETMTPMQLSQNPRAFDHLLRAAVEALETQ